MGEETTSSRDSRVQGRRTFGAGLVAMLAALVLAACGGDNEPQSENEPVGDFPVEVTTAKFPARQRLADTNDLVLEIENTGDETVPDLAVTISTGDEQADGPFNVRSDQQGLADPNRPVWVLENDYPKLLTPTTDQSELDDAPTAGAETAATNTYAFGPLEAGDSITAVWRVTPVQGGNFTVNYEVAAGLDGNAKAVTDDGSPVSGEFVTTISTKPPATKVNDAGKVVPE